MNCCWCGHEIPENTSVCFKCGKQQVINYMVECGDRQVNCSRIFKPEYSDKDIIRILRSYGLKNTKECNAFINEYKISYYKYILNKEGVLYNDDMIITDEGMMSYSYALSRYGGISQVVYNVCTAKGIHYDTLVAQILMQYLSSMGGNYKSKKNDNKSKSVKVVSEESKPKKEKKQKRDKVKESKPKGSGIFGVILILLLLLIAMCATVYVLAFM